MESLFYTEISKGKAARPLLELQTALDLDSFWRTTMRLLRVVMPHHSCSLMLGIVGYNPLEARHHMTAEHERGNHPVTSLTISRPYLEAHPRVKMYTYTEVVREDPRAQQRRLERDKQFWGWSEFIHLAFWDGSRPDAILSIRRSEEQGDFSVQERDFLTYLHPLIDAGLRRLRLLERERGRSAGIERFLTGLPMPIMFLEPDCKLGFATHEAYDLCAVWNHGFKAARSMSTRRCFSVPLEIITACLQLAAAWEQLAAEGNAAGLQSVRVVHPQISGLIAKVDVCQPLRGSLLRAGFWVTLSCEKNVDGADAELTAEALHCLQYLTPSERRVALLVAVGCHSQDVARRLGKSPRTVDFQLNMIYRKLGVSGRIELARLLR